MNNRQLLSYSNLLEERRNFRSNRSRYDEPGLFYFKILFYFNNPGEDLSNTSNLLGLGCDIDNIQDSESWKPIDHFTDSVGQQDGAEPAAYSANTAYNYLIINGENERASHLKDFIYLLSEISANTPWYFKSIEGLDNAIDRPFYKEFKFEDTPRELTITCLHESVDNRITTLLELYRAACWSQRWKREIVPENLRKFDMGIYIFQTPINGISYTNTDKRVIDYINQNNLNHLTQNSANFTNSIYLEFHNCEIDQNSLKSCFSSIDNSTGLEIEPKITITYNDCITTFYNESLCKSIGDLVSIDINSRDIDKYKYESNNSAIRSSIEGNNINSTITNKLDNLVDEKVEIDNFKHSKILKTVVDNTIGKATEVVKKTIRKAYLGNVYGMSIRNMIGSVQQIASGDLIGGTLSTINSVAKTVDSAKKGNVVHDLIPSIVDKKQPTTPGTVRELGNVHPQTIKNNL